uniref:Uncharacterized protein n=1 Tax=Oryza sativa subsp. japonica TaxID=39947 RepID=Q6ZLL1_ORYSJ|nr:hypothetical protein [Oryza sativa Japonica Group]BAD30609.1 hypothetical protein [Oryza sativa Japonica Group]
MDNGNYRVKKNVVWNFKWDYGRTRRRRQREELALGGAGYAWDEAAELNEAQEDTPPREEAALVGVRRQQTEEPELGGAGNARDEAAKLNGAQETRLRGGMGPRASARCSARRWR